MAAVKRDVQSILLVLVGGTVLRLSISDAYLNYVKPGLRPFLIVSGAMLLVLGMAGFVLDGLLRQAPAAGPACADGDDHGPRVAWLLCLPVLAVFLVAPPALGSYAAQRDPGTVAKPQEAQFPPLPEGDPVQVLVSEYAIRAVWDQGRSLRGRTVTLTGFVTPKPGGGWYLTRMVLSCCAADAQAFKVEVRDAPPLAPDTWVEVTGTWAPHGDAPPERAVPVIQASHVKEVPRPKDPYE
ncbi:TIGR03943 family putative permease subunit [Carbonactinospora thermoautotrophica]|uniref:TIGR03943 family putative permease subunit n=1 Tax=Carbonactinospora thermoautotrophica TaxID=1469144 RepID=UPI0027DF13E8|nr:TIGR03943 family protein [Carbonactinospora thermoautotrophica]